MPDAMGLLTWPADIMESLGGRTSALSTAYRCQQTSSCLRLFRHTIAAAFSLDFVNAGRSKAARIAMIAITTSNSIRVKPPNEDFPHAWEHSFEKRIAGRTILS